MGRVSDKLEKILGEYDKELELLESFVNKMESLVKEFIFESGLNVHSVTSRVKKRDSLEGKFVVMIQNTQNFAMLLYQD